MQHLIAGYAVGKNWHSIVNDFQVPTYVVIAAVVLVLAIVIWRHVRCRKADDARWTGKSSGAGRAQAASEPRS